MEFTVEQQEAAEKIMQKVEASKADLMRCIICDTQTHDRGLICVGVTLTSVIICGVCYPCKNLPGAETEIKRRIQEYLIASGREELLLPPKT